MTDQITHIVTRVGHLEERLEENVNKINGRLDQIVDLMQKVTVLQEREVKNADQINDLRVTIKELNSVIKEWNSRLHERMDNHVEEIRICREGLVNTLKNLEDEVDAKVEKIEQKNQATRDELEKWLNRGIGAWALASILIIVLQSMGAYIINGILEDDNKTEQRVERLEIRAYEVEKQYHELHVDFNGLKKQEDKDHNR